MKLYAFLIYDKSHKLIHSNYNLDDFFFVYRPIIKNNVENITANIINKIGAYGYYQIDEKVNDTTIIIYGIVDDQIYIVITDSSYPKNVAYDLIHQTKKSNLTNPTINNLFISYQDPIKIDPILKIKQEMNETQIIMLDSIDKLLARGEKIEDLMEKSEKLSDQSFVFKKKAKDLNSCCRIF